MICSKLIRGLQISDINLFHASLLDQMTLIFCAWQLDLIVRPLMEISQPSFHRALRRRQVKLSWCLTRHDARLTNASNSQPIQQSVKFLHQMAVLKGTLESFSFTSKMYSLKDWSVALDEIKENIVQYNKTKLIQTYSINIMGGYDK